jgi:hypothetical protein
VLRAETRNRVVDRVRLVAFAREPVAHLLFGKLASREHLEPVEICVIRQSV